MCPWVRRPGPVSWRSPSVARGGVSASQPTARRSTLPWVGSPPQPRVTAHRLGAGLNPCGHRAAPRPRWGGRRVRKQLLWRGGAPGYGLRGLRLHCADQFWPRRRSAGDGPCGLRGGPMVACRPGRNRRGLVASRGGGCVTGRSDSTRVSLDLCGLHLVDGGRGAGPGSFARRSPAGGGAPLQSGSGGPLCSGLAVQLRADGGRARRGGGRAPGRRWAWRRRVRHRGGGAGPRRGPRRAARFRASAGRAGHPDPAEGRATARHRQRKGQSEGPPPKRSFPRRSRRRCTRRLSTAGWVGRGLGRAAGRLVHPHIPARCPRAGATARMARRPGPGPACRFRYAVFPAQRRDHPCGRRCPGRRPPRFRCTGHRHNRRPRFHCAPARTRRCRARRPRRPSRYCLPLAGRQTGRRRRTARDRRRGRGGLAQRDQSSTCAGPPPRPARATRSSP